MILSLRLLRSIAVFALVLSIVAVQARAEPPQTIFPGKSWQTRSPRDVGLDAAKLREFAAALRGDGVVIRDGYLVHSWGRPERRSDWASAAKPVISTLLLFAVHEGTLNGPDDPVRPWVRQRWPEEDLIEKDRGMTFRHLADMTSGYARGERPGTHWAYNDLAISLYRHLMIEVLGGSLNDAALLRLSALQFEDGDLFGSRGGGGVNTSPRDFARVGWFWLNRGNWAGRQLLPRALFDEHMRPDVPRDLPRTKREGKDYLEVGSYGGGSDQEFAGQGVYGFNWWFNAKMATSDELLLPHLPEDAFCAIGHRGKEVMLVVPSLRLVVAARGDWGDVRLERARILREAVLDSETATGMVFPGEQWEQARPESQDVDSAGLAQAVKFLEEHAGRDGARELVIVRNGRMIWSGDNIDKVHNVWSCTKSFTSTVLGLLVDDGKCTLNTQAAEFVPELAADYSGVTLRHFTTMTSGYRAVGDDGRSHGQSSTPFDPHPEPLFEPGAKFAYWDSAQNQFGQVLTRIAEEPIAELFRRRIADPIGMDPEKWRWADFGERGDLVVHGGAGNKSKGISISAREMARFGLLYLNQGRWDGRQLLSREWVRQATSVPLAASLPWGHPESGLDGRGCYGFNWWTNGQKSDGELKWPDAPAGTFAASGHNNNRCFVVPEWKMVIVRLGLDQADHKITDEEWSAFLRLVGKALRDETP